MAGPRECGCERAAEWNGDECAAAVVEVGVTTFPAVEKGVAVPTSLEIESDTEVEDVGTGVSSGLEEASLDMSASGVKSGSTSVGGETTAKTSEPQYTRDASVGSDRNN